MTSVKKLTILFFVMILTSCISQKDGLQNVNQGIKGTVKWLEGNMMPSPEEPNLAKGRGVERQLFIYEAVNFDKVEGQAPLFKKINATLVKKVKTNTEGIFACELPEGTYSVFTSEPDGLFFANSFDGNGLINSVKVERNKVSVMSIEVNYKAAY